MEAVSIFWFRRDLRLQDNAGLYHALKGNNPVVPLFIFDSDILDKLDDPEDKRVEFIHFYIKQIHDQLTKLNSSLIIRHGKPVDIFKDLINTYKIECVFTNHDFEPYANERDAEIDKLLTANNIRFKTYKDHVIFEKQEVIKDDGLPYSVYSPYSRKWKAKLKDFYLKPYPTSLYFSNFCKMIDQPIPSLEDIGFRSSGQALPPIDVNTNILKNYHETRNDLGIEGTSRVSVHLRFGTISIRNLANTALNINETYLNEVIWRDFFAMILHHFPNAVNNAFKPAYDRIKWRNNEDEYKKWQLGITGYPIVDAGMRELNQTGYMHNRARLITASFLCKHLLIDWRWGENYFAKKLLDYDLSSNNGNWQWASGSGCDAAPYFRMFNPYLQTKKFDKDLAYIKKWVPEFQEFTYPKPIVDHDFARKRMIETYNNGLKQHELLLSK